MEPLKENRFSRREALDQRSLAIRIDKGCDGRRHVSKLYENFHSQFRSFLCIVRDSITSVTLLYAENYPHCPLARDNKPISLYVLINYIPQEACGQDTRSAKCRTKASQRTFIGQQRIQFLKLLKMENFITI